MKNEKINHVSHEKGTCPWLSVPNNITIKLQPFTPNSITRGEKENYEQALQSRQQEHLSHMQKRSSRMRDKMGTIMLEAASCIPSVEAGEDSDSLMAE